MPIDGNRLLRHELSVRLRELSARRQSYSKLPQIGLDFSMNSAPIRHIRPMDLSISPRFCSFVRVCLHIPFRVCVTRARMEQKDDHFF